MSYREILRERTRAEHENSPEPRVLDYLEHRNDQAIEAWRRRRCEYELARPASETAGAELRVG